MLKKFFKDATCTSVLRPVFLGVEQETGLDIRFFLIEFFSATMFYSTEFAQSALLLKANGSWSLLRSVWLDLHKNDNSLVTLCSEWSNFLRFFNKSTQH